MGGKGAAPEVLRKPEPCPTTTGDIKSPTPPSCDGQFITNGGGDHCGGGGKAGMGGGDGASSEKDGGENDSRGKSAPAPSNGGFVAASQSASSLPPPRTPGDANGTYRGTQFPVGAQTPTQRQQQQGQEQEEPPAWPSSSPPPSTRRRWSPIESFQSDAASVVDSWEGETEQQARRPGCGGGSSRAGVAIDTTPPSGCRPAFAAAAGAPAATAAGAADAAEAGGGGDRGAAADAGTAAAAAATAAAAKVGGGDPGQSNGLPANAASRGSPRGHIDLGEDRAWSEQKHEEACDEKDEVGPGEEDGEEALSSNSPVLLGGDGVRDDSRGSAAEKIGMETGGRGTPPRHHGATSTSATILAPPSDGGLEHHTELEDAAAAAASANGTGAISAVADGHAGYSRMRTASPLSLASLGSTSGGGEDKVRKGQRGKGGNKEDKDDAEENREEEEHEAGNREDGEKVAASPAPAWNPGGLPPLVPARSGKTSDAELGKSGGRRPPSWYVGTGAAAAAAAAAPFPPPTARESGGSGRGAATADDTQGSSGSAANPSKAVGMFARLRSAAKGGFGGGGSSLFTFRRRAAVGPLVSPRQPPAPDAEAAAGAAAVGKTFSPVSPFSPSKGGATFGESGGKVGAGGAAPEFGGGPLGKTPQLSPSCSTPARTERLVTASPAKSLARRAPTSTVVEGDLEDGGVRVAAAAAAATQARALAEVAGAESRLVLAEAPTDEEKVLYKTSGRFALLTCAIVCFIALTAGMWLFTLVTPAFYWFGVPAAVLFLYSGLHYFAVAVWGKDLRFEDHAEVVRRSEEGGYQPAVDVYLPVCREPLHLLANTWKHVAALDYDPGALKVYVLDDGQSEEVRALAAAFGFEYIVRANAPELRKAGNLRNAFAVTTGEAIAIFDADFCPRPDFLKETVPYLGQDATVGIVQTPQFFRYREEQTWVEKGAGVTQELFYRLVQVNQDKFNAAVCVGSCGLYRRAALEALGGMAAIDHSEDMYTGFKMTEQGYKIKYVPLALAMGICPDEPESFFMQQYRWCKGSITLVGKRQFWWSNISKIHKVCFLNGMLYYIVTAMLVFVAPLPILLLVWAEEDDLLWYHSCFMLPAIIFALVVMPLWSKQPYGMACHRVKIIQCYAHIFAIKDCVLGRSAPWVPSGLRRSRPSSSAYKSSVTLLIGWNLLITALIVGGSAWRMAELTWYNFLPAMVFAIGSLVLSMSTLVY